MGDKGASPLGSICTGVGRHAIVGGSGGITACLAGSAGSVGGIGGMGIGLALIEIGVAIWWR